MERFLLGALRKLPAGVEVCLTPVNGSDAFVVRKGDGEPYLVGMIGATDLGIERIFFVLNP